MNCKVGRSFAGLSHKGLWQTGQTHQQQITSSTAQELLLELMLFDVFAGDLDDEIEQTLGRSLDDAGLVAVVSTWRMVAQELQQVIVVGWQGPPGFGEGKCKALLWGQSHAIHSPGWVRGTRKTALQKRTRVSWVPPESVCPCYGKGKPLASMVPLVHEIQSCYWCTRRL